MFTFAANDGTMDSNPGTGTVSVVQGSFSLHAEAHVPVNYPAGWPAPFRVVATPVNLTAVVSNRWSYGDGTPDETGSNVVHTYTSPGNYSWSVVSAVSDGITSVSTTNSGTIWIGDPMAPVIGRTGGGAVISWPASAAQAVLEEASALSAAPSWQPSTNASVLGAGRWSVTAATAGETKFYRLRRVQ
jgi:PKD repeat protein